MSEITIKEIKAIVDEGFENQAVFINRAFDTQTIHFDNRMDNKINELKEDLKTDILRLETKVDKALHTEYVNLEVRVKKIEKHLGLGTAT